MNQDHSRPRVMGSVKRDEGLNNTFHNVVGTTLKLLKK